MRPNVYKANSSKVIAERLPQTFRNAAFFEAAEESNLDRQQRPCSSRDL
jgi:hypothetical protein